MSWRALEVSWTRVGQPWKRERGTSLRFDSGALSPLPHPCDRWRRAFTLSGPFSEIWAKVVGVWRGHIARPN